MRSALLCLLFATSGLLVSADASAEEQSHDVRDYQLTSVCAETVEEHDLKTFEINDLVSTPQVVMRQPAAQLYVTEVYFEPYFWAYCSNVAMKQSCIVTFITFAPTSSCSNGRSVG